MFRNVIWDVDGTLFDTYPSIARAFQSAMHDLGHDVSADWVEGLAKVSLAYCAAALAEVARVNPDALADHFDTHYDRVRAADQPPFPGVTRVCDAVNALGGKNVIVTHRGREGTDELLQAAGMTGLFVDIVTRSDGFPKKPDPSSFLAIMNRNELAPGETIAVGDRMIDIQAGQAAGVFTCLFGEPSASVEPGGEAAKNVRPGLVITDFARLERFLRQRETVRGWAARWA